MIFKSLIHRVPGQRPRMCQVRYKFWLKKNKKYPENAGSGTIEVYGKDEARKVW